jgi:hypothetical protein
MHGSFKYSQNKIHNILIALISTVFLLHRHEQEPIDPVGTKHIRGKILHPSWGPG